MSNYLRFRFKKDEDEDFFQQEFFFDRREVIRYILVGSCSLSLLLLVCLTACHIVVTSRRSVLLGEIEDKVYYAAQKEHVAAFKSGT